MSRLLWTPSEARFLADLIIEEKLSYAEAGRRYGVSRQRVLQVLVKFNERERVRLSWETR